jgi:serine/threonine-protein kinase
LRFCLGWAQEVAGQHADATETWRQARSELESSLKEQPENYNLVSDLALTNAFLGDKAAALSLAERVVAENPMEKDTNIAPRTIETFARVAAQTGEADRSITALQKLLSTPGGARFRIPLPLTPALLRLDPMFDPLRNDPRFQKFCQETKP